MTGTVEGTYWEGANWSQHLVLTLKYHVPSLLVWCYLLLVEMLVGWWGQPLRSVLTW